MVTAFITLNSGGWRKGWRRKSSHASPSARRFTTADKGIADQHPFMDLSWTCQIILDAQGTYRHPAPAIRDVRLRSPKPGVSPGATGRLRIEGRGHCSTRIKCCDKCNVWLCNLELGAMGRHRPSESDRAHKGRESRSPGEPPVHLWDLPRI